MRHSDRLIAGAAEPLVASVGREFDAFWRSDHAAVLALGAALTGDWGIAEDLAQDAFAAVHHKWDQIDNPSAWVRRVVVNRAASHWRRRAREAAAFARFATHSNAVVLAPEYDEFWLRVRSLPRRQAQVVALRYLEDQPIADIAAILNVAEGTVKATLSHARAALARSLALEEES